MEKCPKYAVFSAFFCLFQPKIVFFLFFRSKKYFWVLTKPCAQFIINADKTFYHLEKSIYTKEIFNFFWADKTFYHNISSRGYTKVEKI